MKFQLGLVLAIASGAVGISYSAIGQQVANFRSRVTPPSAGWRASPSDIGPAVTANSSREVSTTSANLPDMGPGGQASVTQTAYFQTQGNFADGLPDLPVFPAPGLAQPNSAYPQPSGGPSQFGSLQTQAGNPQAGNPQDVAPAPVLPQGGNNFSNGVQSRAPGYNPTSPPPNTFAPPPAAQLRTATNGNNSNGLRASVNNGVNAQDARQVPGYQDPRQFATGLPFVTPAPSTGRYPTRPYIGPRYQLASYQQSQQNVIAPPGQYPSTQASSTRVPSTLASSTQPLPQYQNPGVYPTAYQQCAPPYPGAGAETYVPPTFTPNLTPNIYTPNNGGYTPLFSLGQENYNVLLGRGLIGQPTVYVPGQPFRNFFRYISP